MSHPPYMQLMDRAPGMSKLQFMEELAAYLNTYFPQKNLPKKKRDKKGDKDKNDDEDEE